MDPAEAQRQKAESSRGAYGAAKRTSARRRRGPSATCRGTCWLLLKGILINDCVRNHLPMSFLTRRQQSRLQAPNWHRASAEGNSQPVEQKSQRLEEKDHSADAKAQIEVKAQPAAGNEGRPAAAARERGPRTRADDTSGPARPVRATCLFGCGLFGAWLRRQTPWRPRSHFVYEPITPAPRQQEWPQLTLSMYAIKPPPTPSDIDLPLLPPRLTITSPRSSANSFVSAAQPRPAFRSASSASSAEPLVYSLAPRLVQQTASP